MCKAEGKIIRGIGALNQLVAGRTRKEYNIEEKEKILLYNKEQLKQ